MVKILIVEDERETKESIKEYFSRALKCEIQEAEKGEEALDKIKSDKFDLIILDIRLPGISGIDILKRVKKDNLNLDFLVISGWDSLSVAEEALNYGATDYLPKPFSMDILGKKVEEILTRKNKYFPK